MLVLALVMSESVIDSLQLGIASTISATFLKGYSMWFARAVVVLINIIIVPFALATTTCCHSCSPPTCSCRPQGAVENDAYLRMLTYADLC